MPVYEYECGDCNSVFEYVQGISEDAKQKLVCPKCGGLKPVKRLVSLSNFRCFGQHSPYTPKGSRQSKVKMIGGQAYDEASWNAKKTGRRLKKGTTIKR